MLLPSNDELNNEDANEEYRGSISEMNMNEKCDQIALLMSS